MKNIEATEEHEKNIEMSLAKPLTAVASYGENAMVRKDDEKDRRKALLKIDFCIMPFLCLSVMLQFLDKFSLGYAKTMGMNIDANISGTDYAWSGSIFYFGYLSCLPFATLLLQRFRVNQYLAVNCFLWGVIMSSHAAFKSSSALLALRFLLGFFEGGLIPCTTMLTANFYTKSQQVPRAAIWQSMNGVSILIGAPMAYALLNDRNIALASWRIMFLILGGLTILLSILMALVLPLSPQQAHFLTFGEKVLINEELSKNVDATQGKGDPKQQFKEAWCDIRLYLFSLLPFATSITNGGITVFSTTLISSYGFDRGQSILLTMPSGVVQVVGVLIYVGLYRLTRTRCIPALICLVLSVIGAALVVGLSNSDSSTRPARMAGLNLIVFFVIAQAAALTYIASNVGGHMKRVVFSTVYQVGYAIGNIVGPQTYQPSDAPDYVPAKIGIVVTLAAALVLFLAITFVHYLWNKQKNSRGDEGDKENDHGVEGLTDKQ